MILVNADEVGKWVSNKIGGTWFPGRAQALGWLRDGRIVGGVIYDEFNGVNVMAHIAGEGNWLTKRFLWVMFDYPFTQLGVKRITAPISSSNSKAQRFVERLGFEHEATLRGAHPDGDLMIYKMTASNCRWLKD